MESLIVVVRGWRVRASGLSAAPRAGLLAALPPASAPSAGPPAASCRGGGWLAGRCGIGGHGRWWGVNGEGVVVGGSRHRAGRGNGAGGSESWLAVVVLGGDQDRAAQQGDGEQADSDDIPMFGFPQFPEEVGQVGLGLLDWIGDVGRQAQGGVRHA